MRIVDVCAFYSPAGGGVKTYVERKLRAGAAAGHEIVVLAPGERDDIRHFGRGARIVTIAAPKLGRLGNRIRPTDQCEPWRFGAGGLMLNLAKRGLL